MAGVFYPPAFAALTGWYGPDRVRALTTLTLAAGFASTIFAPLTADLAGHLGWRHAYLVLAGILAVVTIPAHALALRLPWAQPATDPRCHRPQTRGPGQPDGSCCWCQHDARAFALYAVVFNLVPLLTGRGLSPSMAAWALGLGGAGQVAGRLCYRPGRPRRGARRGSWRSWPPAAALHPPAGPAARPGSAAHRGSLLAGTVRGLFTLLEATASATTGDRPATPRSTVCSAHRSQPPPRSPRPSAQRWRPASADTRHCSSSWPAPAHSAPRWPWPLSRRSPGISQAPVSRPPACPRPAEPGPGRQRLARHESAA